MELRKEAVAVREVIAEECCEILADGDMNVPDVKPDIRKILQVEATAYLSEKTAVRGGVSLAGRVDLTILYAAEGEEEEVQNIHTSLAFSHRIEREGILPEQFVHAEADVLRAEFHLIHSRKLSLKAIVGLECEVLSRKELSFAVGTEGEACEVQTETITLTADAADRSETFFLQETVTLPQGNPPIRELLRAEFRICDREVRPLFEKVIVKGCVRASVLYQSTDGTTACAEFELPFTEVPELPEVTEEMECSVSYTICDCSYTPSPAADGEMREILLEMTICADLHATRPAELDVIRDCYCPGYETVLDFEETEFEEIVASPTVRHTLRETAEVAPGLPQVTGVCHAAAKTMVNESRIEGEKILVEGKTEVTVLYLTDRPEQPLYSLQKEIPFRLFLDAPGVPTEAACAIRAETEHVSYRLNAANEIELRCVLEVSAELSCRRKVRRLTEATVSADETEETGGILVYFAQAGDTAWDIAKRYRVPVGVLAEENSVSAQEPLEMGTRLLIPPFHH